MDFLLLWWDYQGHAIGLFSWWWWLYKQVTWLGHVTFPTVMWPVSGGQKNDYVIRSCDLFLGGQKIWLCKQVTWPGHVTFSHGHMTFFGGKKCDYVIRSHDQIPTVMWSCSYGQVGNWTHNPNLVISLHNKKIYMLEKSEKIRKNSKKYWKNSKYRKWGCNRQKWLISLYNQIFLLARKIQINPKKF